MISYQSALRGDSICTDMDRAMVKVEKVEINSA